MAENKTKPTSASVEDFINSVKDEEKRKDRGICREPTMIHLAGHRRPHP